MASRFTGWVRSKDGTRYETSIGTEHIITGLVALVGIGFWVEGLG